MSQEIAIQEKHPTGEPAKVEVGYPEVHRLQTIGGSVDVRWSEEGRVSLLGPAAFFVEFLTLTGRWEEFVENCPLSYSSPNAPTKNEILGTMLVSGMNGHRRYAHITGLRGDLVTAGLLGIKQFRSEDSVRRAFEKQDPEKLTLWMDKSLGATYEPLLPGQDWILDIDSTVKTLYGRQEEAKLGYNPAKPGRRRTSTTF